VEPKGEDEPKAQTEVERIRQETDELFLANQSLLAAIKALAERAKKLVEEHVEIVKALQQGTKNK
jgi:hypothetical protein